MNDFKMCCFMFFKYYQVVSRHNYGDVVDFVTLFPLTQKNVKISQETPEL